MEPELPQATIYPSRNFNWLQNPRTSVEMRDGRGYSSSDKGPDQVGTGSVPFRKERPGPSGVGVSVGRILPRRIPVTITDVKNG